MTCCTTRPSATSTRTRGRPTRRRCSAGGAAQPGLDRDERPDRGRAERADRWPTCSAPLLSGPPDAWVVVGPVDQFVVGRDRPGRLRRPVAAALGRADRPDRRSGCGGPAEPASPPSRSTAPTWAARSTGGRRPACSSAPATAACSTPTARSPAGRRRGRCRATRSASSTASVQLQTGPVPIGSGAGAMMRARGVWDWLDDRLGISEHGRAARPRTRSRGVNWWYVLGSATLIAFIDPGRHRRRAGVQLRAGARSRLREPRVHHQPRRARQRRARHPLLGLVGDGRAGGRAHGAGLPDRRLQVPARAELADRRRPARADARHGVHRPAAALEPGRLLGGRGCSRRRPRGCRWSATCSSTCSSPARRSAARR